MILRLRKLKYYNKAEEKINAVKKYFNPNIISTVYEDGRYIAYPKSKNPRKDTQEKKLINLISYQIMHSVCKN